MRMLWLLVNPFHVCVLSTVLVVSMLVVGLLTLVAAVICLYWMNVRYHVIAIDTN